MINQISDEQITDSSIVEENELKSTGLAGSPFSSLSVVSVTASTKTIIITGDVNSPRIQEDDIVVISGNAASGIYSVDSITDDDTFTVKETILDAAGGTVDFYYRSGAKLTGFDNTISNFTNKNVQDVIDEIGNKVDVSASPGLSWGKGGTVSLGAYLLNSEAPSNVTGRPVPVSNGVISSITIAIQNPAFVTFDIQKRTGTTLTTIISVSINSALSITDRVVVIPLNVAVNESDELCCRVSPDSEDKPANPNVSAIIKGITT